MVFAIGSSQGTVEPTDVGLLTDNLVEDDESFQAVLSAPGGESAVGIGQGTTVVTIEDASSKSTNAT